jgi:NADH:ubiquinone oxidoreductase subunit 4 (subunit M)
MFLLVGWWIQRTGTDSLAGFRRDGEAPLLATVVMVVGMLTLAVPGSANFAGEFATWPECQQGWGYWPSAPWQSCRGDTHCG